MSRLLFLAAIIVAVYLVLKSYRGNRPADRMPEQAEDMVRCAHCGVHIPGSESLAGHGKHFCCDAHRRAYQPPSRSSNAG